MAIGLAGFILVGLALGLLGGGGSILAVPVLVNVLNVPARTAVPMSLPVVGIAAAVGALLRWRSGQLRLGTLGVFAGFAMTASFLAARYGGGIGDRLRVILFAAVMLIAAVAMWRRAARMQHHAHAATPRPTIQIIPAAVAVGALTGILGIGGGFMIVPALVGVLGLPLPQATATSLAVIALNAGAAGLGYRTRHVTIDVGLTAAVTVAALLGMGIGTVLAPRISSRTLTRGFAVLLVALAAVTLITEFTRT